MRALFSGQAQITAAAALVVLTGLTIANVPLSGRQPSAARAYVPDELLVRFRSEASTARRSAVASALAATMVRRFDHVGAAHVRLRAGMSVQTAMAILQSDPDVLASQPNFIRRIDAPAPPNDPYWIADLLWGPAKIQAPAAWSTFTTGSTTGAIVADIDSGVNYGHADLAANMWKNPREIAGNGIDDDGNGYVDDIYGIDSLNHDSDPWDDNGHGTHTAGTIGGVGNNGIGVVGVNWNARILACKFIDTAGQGTDSDAIECFNYVVALKNRGENIRVTTNSWGARREASGPGLVLKGAIDAAGAAGILNVFAAGNDGLNNDVTPFDPASYTSPSIISVAASTSTDGWASFSNYGVTSVDLAAPGANIWSTYGNGYAPLNGTSMATPHVAGAAALILAQQPNLTTASLKSLLMNSVDPLPVWASIVASGGRLNVYKAMLALTPNVAPTVDLTGPADNAAFVAPAIVTISATAGDSDGTVARVDFVVNGAVAASDTIAPYSTMLTNVAAGSYTFSAIATDNGGASTATGTRTFTVSPPAGGGASVAFVTADAATQGSWKGVYGGDGRVIVGDTTSLPAYAQVTASGQSTWTWAASTGDPRALQRAVSDRVMAAWYGSAFTIDVDVTGTTPRQLAIYSADYDASSRQQRFDLVDASSGALLDSRTLSSFSGGTYLVWNVVGRVRVQVTRLGGPNALVSGVLLGPAGGGGGGGGGGGTATYVRTDSGTQGTWTGTYGSEGYTIAGDSTSLPADAQIQPSGQASWTWAASTGDVRALQRVGGGRVMAAWYGTTFSIDVNIGGTQARQLAIYSADYDNSARQQRFDLLDGSSGATLDSRTLSTFGGGQYVVWSVLGHVTVRVTSLNGPNALVSGVFLGAAAASGNASATFVKADAVTQGTWKGVYGTEGYVVVADAASLPSSILLEPSGASSWTWSFSTSDVRALQRAGTDRVMAAWYGTAFALDLTVSGTPRQIAIYAADYDNSGRQQRFELVDASSGAVIDSRTLSSFAGGQYLVWDIQGHVRINVTRLAGPNAVISGVFAK